MLTVIYIMYFCCLYIECEINLFIYLQIYGVPVSPSEYDPWPRVWRELDAASGCDGTASRSHTEVPPLSHQAAREVSDFLIQSNLVSSDTCSGIFSYSQTSLVQTHAQGFSHTVKLRQFRHVLRDFLIQSNLVSSDTCSGIFSYCKII